MSNLADSNMKGGEIVNGHCTLPTTSGIFSLQSSAVAPVSKKPASVMTLESQQKVASVVPYLPVAIPAETGVIYPSLNPLAAAAAAYYNANCQTRPSNSTMCSDMPQSTAAANLINAALSVGTKLGNSIQNSSAVSQSHIGATPNVSNEKQPANGDLTALRCGMQMPDVGSFNHSLISGYTFSPATQNVGILPNATMDTAWATAAAAAASYHPYGTMAAYSMDIGGARRKNATRETTSTLKSWLQEHMKNPYPTKGEKIMLAIITKMTLTQVSTWFANARRRLKKENKMIWSPRNRCDNEQTGSATGSDSQPEDSTEKPAAFCNEVSLTRNNIQKINPKESGRLDPKPTIQQERFSQMLMGDNGQANHSASKKIWSLAQTATLNVDATGGNRSTSNVPDKQASGFTALPYVSLLSARDVECASKNSAYTQGNCQQSTASHNRPSSTWQLEATSDNLMKDLQPKMSFAK